MNEPMRKRIVINLDSPRANRDARDDVPSPDGRRGGIWLRVILFVTAFFALLVMLSAFGGFIWWRHFQTTPAYTLALIIDGAQRDDTDAVANQIDDEAVAKNMMTNVANKASGQYGLTLSTAMHRQVEKLLPSLLPDLKQTMRREIAKEVREFSVQAQNKPFLVIALAVTRLANITTEGNTARVIATIRDRKVELAMHLDGDQWKVVDFKDDVLTQRIVDGVMKDLPSIGGFELGNMIRPRNKSPDNVNETH